MSKMLHINFCQNRSSIVEVMTKKCWFFYVSLCSGHCLATVSDVSDFIQFEIWDIPGQFKLGDIDAVATFSCTGTLIFIIDSQVVSYI